MVGYLGRDADSSARFGDGLNSIREQIVEYRLQTVGVGFDRWKRLAVIFVDFDVARLPTALDGFIETGIDIGWF